MSIIIKLNLNDFIGQFRKTGRFESFSYKAYSILYDYYTELDTDWEMDVVEICTDWSEFSADEFVKYHQIDIAEYDLESIDDIDFSTLDKMVSDNCGSNYYIIDSQTILVQE